MSEITPFQAASMDRRCTRQEWVQMRKALQLTQAKLAFLLGVTDKVISQCERGFRAPNLASELVLRGMYAQSFGVPFELRGLANKVSGIQGETGDHFHLWYQKKVT